MEDLREVVGKIYSIDTDTWLEGAAMGLKDKKGFAAMLRDEMRGSPKNI